MVPNQHYLCARYWATGEPVVLSVLRSLKGEGTVFHNSIGNVLCQEQTTTANNFVSNFVSTKVPVSMSLKWSQANAVMHQFVLYNQILIILSNFLIAIICNDLLLLT